MTTKTVMLVAPASRMFNHYRPPLGLMYLSGYLKKNGISARVVDITLRHQVRDKKFAANKDKYQADAEDAIVETVKKADTDIVGVSCYTPELKEVNQLVDKIKKARPDVKLVIGGIHPTLYPEQMIGPSSRFDFAVCGEGEEPLLALVKAIRSGTSDFRNVAGIAYYDAEKKQNVITPLRSVTSNLDDIVVADYDDLDMDYYTTPSPYLVRGVFVRGFHLMASRGCPSSCIFCVSRKMREFHGGLHYTRLRSPASLIKEITMLREKYGIDAFYFIDDLFTLKKDNVLEFCRMLIEANLHVIWACQSRVNTVDYEMLKAMRDSGCVQVDFGVEKGSDKALAAIRKGITIAQIKAAFGHCKKLGMRTFANMLLNTPGETEEDLADMQKLLDEIKPTIVLINIFTPYPGCEIFDARCNMFTIDDYSLMMMNPIKLMTEWPEKFRFCSHSVALNAWVSQNMRTYNSVLPNLAIHFHPRYLSTIAHSRYKMRYIRKLADLAQEFINQRSI